MAEYKLIEDNKRNILKKRMFKSLPLIIIAVIAGLGISFSQMAQIGNSNIFILIILLALLICAGAVFVGLKIGLKIYKENHLDIIFSIKNRNLKIIKRNKEIISATEDNIKKIEEYSDGSIIVFLKNNQRIMLNKNIENYTDLKIELNEIIQINKSDKKPKNIIYTITSLGIIILYIIFSLGKNKMLIISSGLLIIGIILFSLIKTVTDKSVDKRIKITFLVALILVFDIVAKIIAMI
jgi:chromate transport protein ChrA